MAEHTGDFSYSLERGLEVYDPRGGGWRGMEGRIHY